MIGDWLAGRLLGLEDTQSIERIGRMSFAASWAHDAPAWLLFALLGLVVLSLVFYLRLQASRQRRARIALAVMRMAVLMLVLVALAEPHASLIIATRLRPTLCLLFDGSESMSIADELPPQTRQELEQGIDPSLRGGGTNPTARMDYVKARVKSQGGDWIARLEKQFRLQAYLFDRAEGVRLLELAAGPARRSDPAHLAEQLTATGPVTALGSALEDLTRRSSSSSLAGLVIFSDFNQNAGPSALEAARQLGARVFAVGVGPAAALDLAVDLQAPPVAKKDERTTVTVRVHQQGAAQQQALVKLTARPGGAQAGSKEPVLVGEKAIELRDATHTLEFAYLPNQVGTCELTATVDPLPGEVVRENNRAQRDLSVRDDFIRLLFVEYEPTWEWRFIKEVFHRDKLVGLRGFRTFLRSSDPKVRQNNELFLPSMSPPRSQFFQYDVILLGDLPATALNPRFCEMTEEFVGQFGGGLVVISGPRFGSGQLAQIPLGKMLPVIVEAGSRVRDHQPFTLQLRPESAQVDFMQLGGGKTESDRAWANLGPLPWYQPVDRVHPLAAVLAEHPRDLCSDGKTRQPVIALRRYGRGEVVWLGFNETWRLRRMYGEQYYRQFWGQMIHRLALSHALGTQKRFVVRTDRPRYQAGDQVLVTVEAYDNDFQPLAENAVSGGALQGELLLPSQAASTAEGKMALTFTALRRGVYEARFPALAGGEYRVRVADPLAREAAEVSFPVTALSVERERAVRNVALQEALAETTGGKAYDLVTVGNLPEEIRLTPKVELQERVVALWNTWLVFGLVVLLLLAEWLLRKRVSLP